MGTSVLYFALNMQRELDNNNSKTGWWNLTPKQCLNRLRKEVREVAKAIEQNKSREEVQSECADVGNFAMFLGHNYYQTKDEKPDRGHISCPDNPDW